MNIDIIISELEEEVIDNEKLIMQYNLLLSFNPPFLSQEERNRLEQGKTEVLTRLSNVNIALPALKTLVTFPKQNTQVVEEDFIKHLKLIQTLLGEGIDRLVPPPTVNVKVSKEYDVPSVSSLAVSP